MSIHEMQLVWESTNHPFDNYGHVTNDPLIIGGEFDAKTLVIWKKRPFIEFVLQGVELAGAVIDFLSTKDPIKGFALVVNVISIIPLNVKIIENDKDAEEFLRLLNEDDDGKEYFLKSDLDRYPEIAKLVSFYEKNGIIIKKEKKYYINGYILNRAFIVKQ